MKLLGFFALTVLVAEGGNAFAACGGTARTWDGSGNANWNNAANWTTGAASNQAPDTAAEDAVIVSAARVPNSNLTTTIGCLDLQSGSMNVASNTTLTIAGDYFNNPNAGSITMATNNSWKISLTGGALAQRLTNLDALNNLDIRNSNSVTFDRAFTIRSNLTLVTPASNGLTLSLNANLSLDNGGATTPLFTIPTSTTVIVGAGVTLIARGGITVNGTLRIDPGATVLIGSGKTLTIGSGGTVNFNGASGNVAQLDGQGGSTYSFVVNSGGAVSANYFRISRTTAAGLNLSGTIQSMNNGEFHYIAANGYAMTANAGATLPGTQDSLGFFNDSNNAGVKNINATNYNGGVTTINNWSNLGGTPYETDPSNKITWGASAGAYLALTNNTAAGSPPTTIGASSTATLFTTFGFSLTQISTISDIRSIAFTVGGTNSSADIAYLKVFKDSNANCTYEAGTDTTQLGSNLNVTGTPPTATLAIAAGQLQVSGPTLACIHVLLATSANAANGDTLQVGIDGTVDVTNLISGGGAYNFSTSSGPPIYGGTASIVSSAPSYWDGTTDSSWAQKKNWNPTVVPTSTGDCVIDSGSSIPILTANVACRNASFNTGGTLSFNGGAWELAAYGSLTGQTGYTFTNAGSGVFALRGTTNQSLSLATTFPGHLLIANTGAAGSNIVTVGANSAMSGNLTINSGQLMVPAGITLTVGGSVTIANGATLKIAPGGTLALGANSVLTVNAGGTLEIIGTAGQNAVITSTAPANAYTVVVNGTIKAQYYSFNRLGVSGVTINSTATIDSSYYLQNGSYAYPVANNTTLLRLYQQIPGNTLDPISFDAAGSAATGIFNICTGPAVTAGTLTINNYSGSLAGPTYDRDIPSCDGSTSSSYLLAWTGATNTLSIIKDASVTTPTSVNQGQTYRMGNFSFSQTSAGASYLDTDITALKLTLIGTGTASDISQVRIYSDSSCVGSGGTLIGTGSFTGNPGTVTFTGITGVTVDASTTSPTPESCIYVDFDIAANAVNGHTVNASINASTDETNSQNYQISGNTPPPISAGTPATIIGSSTSWIGTTSNAWCTAANWNGGIPTASLNCTINSGTFNPVISGVCGGVTPVCKSLTINSGSLTMNAGTELQVYGSFANSATFTQNTGTLRLKDDGVTATNQTISSTGGSFTNVTFAKTAGGFASATGTAVSISGLTFPSGSNFEWQVQAGSTLTLANGVTLPAGVTFNVVGGGTLAIGNTMAITVSGGTFKTTGINDAYPQTTTNKALITVSGSGTWSFNATTSGTVDLTGFLLDYIDVDGLNLGGSTVLTNLNGGQFTHLSTNYASVKAIQLNTTGTIPAVANNIGWNWGPANSTYNNPPSPSPTTSYFLASSTGCQAQNISFDQWFGDFFVSTNVPDTATKISATNCAIAIAASASPVSLLSFSGAGYNGSVVLDWQTAAETDHAGFNVYRSLEPTTDFIQVNSGLIRNIFSSTTFSGLYRYTDQDIINGLTYYYYIEDVAFNGATTRHGPVVVTPLAAANAAPAVPVGTNSGNSSAGANTGNSPSSGTISTPGLVDLGNGVHILAKTRSSLRVEIIPPPVSYSASTWDPSYESLSLPGYSSLIEASKPELVARTVLIEVEPGYSTATVSNASVTEAATSIHLVQPVPSWAANGSGTLVPTYTADATAYSLASYYPTAFYEVNPALQKIGDKSYLQVKVTPLLFQGSTHTVRKATRIVLDIGLDGSAWATTAPSGAIALSPAAVAGSLRVRFNRTGMYQLAYNDMVEAGVEGPFVGAAVANLRMYYHGTEIPIEVIAAGATFASGDAIRFYVHFIKSFEDSEDEVVLTQYALAGSTDSPHRISTVSADPTAATDSSQLFTFANASAEQDNGEIFDLPIGGSEVDHFYWGRIYQQQGVSQDPSTSDITLGLDLPGNISLSGNPVHLRLYVRGRGSVTTNPMHHLALYINTVPYQAADISFDDTGPTVLHIDVPSGYFVSGTNTILVRALADLAPPNEYDIVDIDRIEADYSSSLQAQNDYTEFYNREIGNAFSITGFNAPASIVAYDVTDPDRVTKQSDISATSPDAGVTFDAKLAPTLGSTEDLGFHIIVINETAAGTFKKPSSLILSEGADSALRSTSQSADLIVVGPAVLLEAAQDLIAARKTEGLRVVQAPLEQVYSEFSNGQVATSAIRDLVNYARTNWAAPAPKYLLILGDATYDPLNKIGYNVGKNVMPIRLIQGTYIDYGSDNWLVTSTDDDPLPSLSVGRIPTSSPSLLSGFVKKLLAYEQGARAPLSEAAKKLVFISDTDKMNEGFARLSDSLASGAKSASGYGTSRISRSSSSALDSVTHASILSAFEASPLMMVYLGHGASDRWAGENVFINADGSGLKNTALPIVVALNCLNSYFYDADPATQSLAETLLLNPEGGTVAFWGSTAMTVPTVQIALAQAFFNEFGTEVKNTVHDVRIGDLALRAKVAIGANIATQDTLHSWTLLGDPSMKLPAQAFAAARTTATASADAIDDDTSSSSEIDSGVSGCACGTIRPGGKGGGGNAGAMEFGLFLLALMGSRRIFGQTPRKARATP